MSDETGGPSAAEALRAYRELSRVARDLSSEPALPRLLAALRAAKQGLLGAEIDTANELVLATLHRNRVAELPTDSLEVIRAVDEAEGRRADAEAAWVRANREYLEVDRVLRGHAP